MFSLRILVGDNSEDEAKLFKNQIKKTLVYLSIFEENERLANLFLMELNIRITIM